jgi:hypothetical protein
MTGGFVVGLQGRNKEGAVDVDAIGLFDRPVTIVALWGKRMPTACQTMLSSAHAC